MRLRNLLLSVLLLAATCLVACADTAAPLADTGGDEDTGVDSGGGGGNDCVDEDNDGYGVGAGCRGTDCDDGNAGVWSGCSSCIDNDDDGYGEGCERGPDCDDSDRNVNPSRTEVPGNGKDDDCQGGDVDCDDGDGDGYGIGQDCTAPDCNDEDAEVNFGMSEICGNSKDDDCRDGDAVCPEDCVDEDGDLYGEGADCLGPDCDDDDRSVNPEAEEVCNGKNDDCDDHTDECADVGDSCDLDRGTCAAGFLSPCVRTVDCVTGLICDADACRGSEGIDCDNNDHCARGFACQLSNRKCIIDPDYNICDDLACDEDCDGGKCCVRERAACVDCLGHIDCPGLEMCAGYNCLEMPWFEFSGDEGVNQVGELAQWVADCSVSSADAIDICGVIIGENLEAAISEDDLYDWICDAEEGDFIGGARDRTAARNTVGCTIFNNDDLRMDADVPAGNLWDYCMWSLPVDGLIDDPDVVIAPCTDYPG